MIQALQLEPDRKYEWLVQRRHQMDLLELEWSMVAADYCATDDCDRRGFTTPIDSLRVGCQMTGPAVADRWRWASTWASFARAPTRCV